jgi:hypothetical protein
MRTVLNQETSPRWTDAELLDEPSVMPATHDELPPLLKHPSLDLELEDDSMGGSASSGNASDRGYSEVFQQQVKRHSRGVEFWDNFDVNMTKTPPSSRPISKVFSVASEDFLTDGPAASTAASTPVAGPGERNGLLPPLPPQLSGLAFASPTFTSDQLNKRLNAKRRRDDDLDFEAFKRRAVSPGLSAQNSPVMPQSPATTGWWSSNSSAAGKKERTEWDLPTSAAQASTATPATAHTGSLGTPSGNKRVGLQNMGMNDAGDGIMKMSIA